jgi:hypothetical protein
VRCKIAYFCFFSAFAFAGTFRAEPLTLSPAQSAALSYEQRGVEEFSLLGITSGLGPGNQQFLISDDVTPELSLISLSGGSLASARRQMVGAFDSSAVLAPRREINTRPAPSSIARLGLDMLVILFSALILYSIKRVEKRDD